MTTPLKWDDSWGPRDEFDFLPSQELEGFRVGDEVRVVDGLDDDEEEVDDERGYFSGEEGVVIGFVHLNKGLFNNTERDVPYVAFEGMDPCKVEFEHIEKSF